jgi:predicted PurR-regulated permease PerM
MVTLTKKSMLLHPKSQTLQGLRYLQAIFFSGAILYFGRVLFIPVLFGLLIAIVMYPVCKGLEKRGWMKSMAVAASLGVVTLLLVLLLALLAWQAQVFRAEVPLLIQKVKTTLPQLQQWLEQTLGISILVQNGWLQNTASAGNLTGVLQGAWNALVNTFFYLFLMPVFAALFLYHRRTFVKCLQLTVGARYPAQLQQILQQTVYTYSRFIKGMVLVYLIVGTLNSIGLLALGIKHAVLFGMLTAVMTIIPYLGILISSLLPISVAWLTKDSAWYPVGVVAIFAFVQYLEANVIFPKVVGTQLNISTWATLVAVIAGGILWGAAGMVLFIPFIAILKIVSDNVEGWKPLQVLLSREETA